MQRNKTTVDNISNFILIFSIVFSINAIFQKPFFSDFDPAWHLEAGYLIRSLGFVPQTDPWSFTSDQTWYNLSWLWDVLISYVNDALSKEYLYLFNAFIFGFLIAYLYQSLNNFGRFNSAAKITTTIVSALIINDLAYVRPQMCTFLLTLIMFDLVKKEKNDRNLLFYVKAQIILLIWVNMHGSFWCFYTIIFAYLLDAFFKKDKYVLKRLIKLSLATFPIIFLNPYGDEIITGTLRTLNSVITPYLFEWKPFTFGHYYGFTIAVIVYLLSMDLKANKLSIAEKFLALFWLLVSLFSLRFFGYLAILGAPFMCANLNNSLNFLKNRPSLPLYTKVICIALTIISWKLMTVLKVNEGEGKDFPGEKIELLASLIPNQKIFNDYNLGGAVIYFGKGKLRHFIDSRAGTVYSEEFLKEYLLFHDMKAPLTSFYEKYKFEGIVLGKEFLKAQTNEQFLKGWIKVFENDKLSIFIHPKYSDKINEID